MRDVSLLERICRELPKADLHLHLDGSVRPETVLAFAKDAGKPIDLPSTLRKMRVAPESRSLPEYLLKFPFVNSFLQSPARLERVTTELLQDCAAENVQVAEIRFCPALHLREGASLDEILDGVLKGFAAGAKATGIKGGVIVDCLREQQPEKMTELAELAVRYKDRGVVALDLAGNEADYDGKNAVPAFQVAGQAGLRRIAHAGEASGPDSIRQAVDELGAERIGHGTHLLGDTKLQAEIAQRGIPLEVCLTSNVHTRAVSDYASHPYVRYLRTGVKVTINTDNRTVSNTTLSHELALAWFWGDLTRDELKRLVVNGVDAAFLPSEEKAMLREKFATEFDAVIGRWSAPGRT
ncbi:MAG TPA: adenosine deaminase [bacterium]|nr:adenosine deaminase [bacterium]